jgi:hypothetical protein
MSTDIDPGCLAQDNLPCDCTYSTLPGPFTATTVATKVGDDFRFRGLVGINGTVVQENGDVIEIDGSGVGTLQTAYDGGNTILVAGGFPVDIQSVTTQSILNVRDNGLGGLFEITKTGVPAANDATIRFANESGILFNNPIGNLTPTVNDPFTRLQVAANPLAVNTTSTIVSSAALPGAAGNFIHSATFAANTVNSIDIVITGVATGGLSPSSFTAKLLVKFAPGSAIPVLISTSDYAVDATLTDLNVGVASVGNVVNFVLIGGPNVGVQPYIVRNFISTGTLTY